MGAAYAVGRRQRNVVVYCSSEMGRIRPGLSGCEMRRLGKFLRISQVQDNCDCQEVGSRNINPGHDDVRPVMRHTAAGEALRSHRPRRGCKRGCRPPQKL